MQCKSFVYKVLFLIPRGRRGVVCDVCSDPDQELALLTANDIVEVRRAQEIAVQLDTEAVKVVTLGPAHVEVSVSRDDL